jgi:hypothetical protein
MVMGLLTLKLPDHVPPLSKKVARLPLDPDEAVTVSPPFIVNVSLVVFFIWKEEDNVTSPVFTQLPLRVTPTEPPNVKAPGHVVPLEFNVELTDICNFPVPVTKPVPFGKVTTPAVP